MIRTVVNQIRRNFSDRFRVDRGKRFYTQDDLVKAMTLKANTLRDMEYIEWPCLIHIETHAICNAKCGFCPYQTMSRKGTKMSDQLIEKIIEDLRDIPKNVAIQIAPYKVSDPFLESRIFDICTLIGDKLPNAGLSFITNASTLTDEKIKKLSTLNNVRYLNVSLNFHKADRYEAEMGIPFERTLHNLDLIHRYISDRKILFPVRITRVAEYDEADRDFLRWTKYRFPLCEAKIIPRNDWIGEMEDEFTRAQIPDAPCHRWFDFSITATGTVGMCCMDGEAQYPKGDVNDHHILDIYNQDHLRSLRENIPNRKDAGDPCNRCTYNSY